MGWFFSNLLYCLSNFQRYYRKYHTKYCHNPETRYNFTFVIPQFLIMVMQWTHQKYPSPLAIFSPGIFEITDLQDDADIFNQENTTKNGNQQFLANDYGKSRNNSAQCQTSGITHENRSR